MKYILKLSFNGTAYHGWQRQENANSVQKMIEIALGILMGSSIEITGCGRTDTGVHARSFFAHFETDNLLNSSFLYQLNSILPHDIAIESCTETEPDFHVRFSAISREYRYFIHWKKNPFLLNQSWFLSKKPDLGAMNEAASILKEYTDFASFCKKGADNKTTICKIYDCRWIEENGQLIFIIRADRFLRNMVRAIVGTLVETGLGKITRDDLRNIIEAADRQLSGTSVPACGLYLWEVKY